MVGFYLLANRILRDSVVAFSAYLLLMFSSLGARLFDSYILLTIIPMIWFFYFLVAFSQEQKRHFLLGMIFAAMILMTTYVPFYFITIFLVFVICGAVSYFHNTKKLAVRYAKFFKDNKLFSWFCIFAFVLSLIPGILLYKDGQKAEVVIPGRHFEAPSENTFSVHSKRVTEGGVTPDIIFTDLFWDLREFKLDMLYIPVFAYILLLLCIAIPFSKRMILFTILGAILFIINITDLTPVYQFLYKHIFYFKLIRNLHYFIWFAILPMFILIVTEQLRIFLKYEPKTRLQGFFLFTAIFTAHLVVILFVKRQGNTSVPTYVTVFLSLLFFVSYFLGWLRSKKMICLMFIFAVVVIQPIEAFYYLSRNAIKMTYVCPGRYGCEKPFLHLMLPKRELVRARFKENRKAMRIDKVPYYLAGAGKANINMGTKWYVFLREYLNRAFHHYIVSPLLVYDRVELIDDDDLDLERIRRVFMENRNVAFISTDNPEHVSKGGSGGYAPRVGVISRDSREVQVLELDANILKLKTNFDMDKFLVYNDSFHTGWKAFVNGVETDVLKANIAFKGIWLPRGENIVYFRFGEKWRYAFNLFMVLFFAGVFSYLMFLCVQYTRQSVKME